MYLCSKHGLNAGAKVAISTNCELLLEELSWEQFTFASGYKFGLLLFPGNAEMFLNSAKNFVSTFDRVAFSMQR